MHEFELSQLKATVPKTAHLPLIPSEQNLTFEQQKDEYSETFESQSDSGHPKILYERRSSTDELSESINECLNGSVDPLSEIGHTHKSNLANLDELLESAIKSESNPGVQGESCTYYKSRELLEVNAIAQKILQRNDIAKPPKNTRAKEVVIFDL